MPRVLVLGAGGWFGQTFLSLIESVPFQLMLIGRDERKLVVNGRVYSVEEWNRSKVELFQPQMIIDFAFLTRNYLEDYGWERYVTTNRALMDRVLWLASLNSVTQILTVSSGAAMTDHHPMLDRLKLDPYGALKSQFEAQLPAIAAKNGVSVVIARAWSVSGGLVRDPKSYALSDFVLQAKQDKHIEICAESLVFRRYCAIEDFIAIALSIFTDGGTLVLDSGGTLVEMAELAEEIARQIPGTVVSEKHTGRSRAKTTFYGSDNEGWLVALRKKNFVPLTFPEQIESVIRSI